jgi:cbb3-type cytochrome c oxidase subunit II
MSKPSVPPAANPKEARHAEEARHSGEAKISVFALGWRGIALVAITYVYFLIFAQFAFLKRLAELGIADTHLKIVMTAMGAGGILFSLLAGYLRTTTHPSLRMRAALLASAVAAFLTTLPLTLATSILVAFLIGSALGLLTVTLVTHLRIWLAPTDTLLQVGLGTGIGYFLCNFPPLFTASPQTQAITAAVLCCIGIFAASTLNPEPAATDESVPQLSFSRVLLCFTALVWLDSAAFFIIQSTPALKAGTWQGNAHLWTNAFLHLAAALVSALLLRRRGPIFVLSAAFAALAAACLLMLDPSRAVLAAIFYPIGVSFYSVALVAYPALLSAATSTESRARRAGWIYAIAGWFGSAMGIGMGQNLGHIPPAFVAAAGLAIFAPQLPALFRARRREIVATTAAVLAAFILSFAINPSRPSSTSAIERGRQVYIAEGCINCHSQYVRPNTRDVALWGPALPLDTLRTEHPPLIGNRRQGPDLSEVGGRRSPLWLRAHFFNPQQVSHDSFMPSYAYLFRNSTRGDDLIAYLANLKSPDYDKHIQSEQTWQPTAVTSSTNDGQQLFASYCSTCHEASGTTRILWQNDFKRLPPNLQTGPWSYLPAPVSDAQRVLPLERIVKFGIPGTDMPGHEYLSDQNVSAIALWLNRSIVQPRTSATQASTSGENR